MVIPEIPGDIKIGVSSDPDNRLVALQTGCGVHLSMHELATTTSKIAAYAFEKYLHTKLHGIRKQGEWFENILLNIVDSFRTADANIEELLAHCKLPLEDYVNIQAVLEYYNENSSLPEDIDVFITKLTKKATNESKNIS